MSDDIKLDSAAAVEVAAFCWPVLEWRPCRNPEQWEVLAVFGYPRVPGGFASQCDDEFCLAEWDSLHRAAAVLVERGLAERLNRNLIGEWDRTRAVGPHTNDFMAWLLSAPADAWARAIVATVREVPR